jgi:hypothetical protein
MPTKPHIHGCSHALARQLLKWSLTHYTGRASLFMAYVAGFGPKKRQVRDGSRPAYDPSLPADFDDFWRCYRLVKACASFKQAFPALRQVSPEWDEFIERWDELCDLAVSEKRRPLVPYSEKFARYRKIVEEIQLKVHGPPAPLTRCQSGSDGECGHPLCPQLVNYKPMCPLYVAPEES